MEQVAIIQGVSLKARERRLKQIMVLASGLCLMTVFYLNGTFSGNIFPHSRPPKDIMAAGGATARTTATTSVSNVATMALAFKAMLTTSQQDTLEQTYTTTLARKWSNLPCGAGCRNGLEFGSLNSAQLAAALAVVQAALGNTYNNGYDEFLKIRLAEVPLNENGGSAYDTSYRWISFLNTPSATGAWMLQVGGHHYAANIAFNNGHVVGATPFFMGVEPSSFVLNDSTYAPLSDENDAFTAMLSSLTTAELNASKLSSTFSDCVMIPGETNGGASTYPAKAGILCSALTSAQKDLVLATIWHYVEDMDSVTAASVMSVYTSQIDSTYISWTGSGTSGDASSFMSAATNYGRIDGPTVWIEFVCQNGVVFPTGLHNHTVWRDHAHDYGIDLSGDPIDTSGSTAAAGVTQMTIYNKLNIYPNPASTQISLSLSSELKDANVVLVNAMGQAATIATHYSGTNFQYDISKLPAGLYILKIQDGSTVLTDKFNKL